MESIFDDAKLDNALKKYNIKHYFTDEFFPFYRSYMMMVKFRRDEYVYHERCKIHYIYFFLNGKIKVCSLVANGRQHLLNLITGVTLLGDLELFGIHNPYIQVQAMEDSYAIAIPVEFTKEKLFKDPNFLYNIGKNLVDKIYKASCNTALNMNYVLKNRLCSYISFGVDEKEINGKTEWYFQFDLTETAELLGTSYRHLQRTLKELREEGLLEKYGKGYIVKDYERITELSSDEFFVDG